MVILWIVNEHPYDLIVIGGGAAGFFGAINTAERSAGARILILEKSTKLLSKVKISGGGRCNVTHRNFEPASLSHHYPRGQRELKKMFRLFQAKDTVEWFESRGVPLKTEEDGRMFPVSDDSQTIIDCFLRRALTFNIDVVTGDGVDQVFYAEELFSIKTIHKKEFSAKKLLVAIGGHRGTEAYSFLQRLGHKIIPTIPSLFTFNDSEKKFTDLMGVAVADVDVKIAGSSFSQRGPVLITHWGLSGPAVIRLSAWAASWLHSVDYNFTALINWSGTQTEEGLRAFLNAQRSENSRRRIVNHPFFAIPQRLWARILALADIPESKIWGEASNKDINRLIELIIRCPFHIHGKTTFKEEFVSCGGVDLREVNPTKMESKLIPGLYFAGEVLDIDGETGGFNFQSAWTTAFIAAMGITSE